MKEWKTVFNHGLWNVLPTRIGHTECQKKRASTGDLCTAYIWTDHLGSLLDAHQSNLPLTKQGSFHMIFLYYIGWHSVFAQGGVYYIGVWLKHDSLCPICFPQGECDSTQLSLPAATTLLWVIYNQRMHHSIFMLFPLSARMKKYYALLTKYSDSHLLLKKACHSVKPYESSETSRGWRHL